jgi:hypothetical protein
VRSYGGGGGGGRGGLADEEVLLTVNTLLCVHSGKKFTHMSNHKRFPEGVCTDDLLSRNLAFCCQLCSVAHLVGFLPLPWFLVSWFSSLTTAETRFGGFYTLCMEKKVGEGGDFVYFLLV